MTANAAGTGHGGTPDAIVPGEFRPARVLVRPRLVLPGDAARDHRRRWREAAAALAWIGHAWLRPAGADARWEQRAGRESLADETRAEARAPRPERPDERAGAAHPTQGQTRTSGTGQ